MQQIRKLKQNKKTPISRRLRICYLNLAGEVAQHWNTIWPSLIGMARKLHMLRENYD
jgi:hypothetical protein